MPIMIIFALAAVAMMTPAIMSWIRQSDQMMIGTVAARQLHAVTKAAQGYITAYAGTIEATATPTTPATITVPMLVATGFLPQGFGAVNPYQQGWVVEVLQPSPGDLQALALSTGGQPIPPRDAPRIGAEAGSAGGAVTSAGTAQGSFGGWTVLLTNYPNPGVGHLAALIDYSNGQLQNDYLYRTAVPGQPQLNTMQTNLSMGGNNITNANGIQANSAALAAGTPNGQQGALQIGGSALEAGATNVRIKTPGSLLLQNQNGTGPAGIGEVNSVALGTDSGTAVPGATCSPNGVIAANANGSGQLMACQNGTWGTAGGGATSNPWSYEQGMTAGPAVVYATYSPSTDQNSSVYVIIGQDINNVPYITVTEYKNMSFDDCGNYSCGYYYYYSGPYNTHPSCGTTTSPWNVQGYYGWEPPQYYVGGQLHPGSGSCYSASGSPAQVSIEVAGMLVNGTLYPWH